MKKLSIIIPFFGQREEELAVPLGSINEQIGVDFSQFDVHLVNDGGPSIDVSRFSIFSNLELHYHEIANSGPGMARQYGIDHSDGQYLMFMDSDDSLQFVGSLLEFFNVCAFDRDYKLIIARYLEQFRNRSGNLRFTTHNEHDWKAVYAKWFSRAYLEEKELRFRSELRIFEDTYFVGLACQLCNDIKYLGSVVYTWRYNPHSLVRINGGKSFHNQLHTWTLENRLYFKKLRRWQPEKLQTAFENYLCGTYLRYKKFGAADEDAFWLEQGRLLREAQDLWTDYRPSLQEQINTLTSTEDSEWYLVDPSKFREFCERGNAAANLTPKVKLSQKISN